VFGPTDLISAARLLAEAEAATEAHFRRAISTAYYALFHHVLSAGAARFLRDGKTDGAAFSVLYRGFSHGRMKTVCESLNAAALSRTFARQFRRISVSLDMRAFATIFLALQEGRQIADYDPLVTFAASDAETFIRDAEAGIAAFDRAGPDEQDDVLALMLTSPRG
jgi:uncharacterized protein (UPF0332 family)